MPRHTFKTYKEKVVYILNCFNDHLKNPQELSWCIHVIKNDFLQISNSMQTGVAGRRFSKTQKINHDETIESGVLNSWINSLLQSYSSNVNMTSSNIMQTDSKSR